MKAVRDETCDLELTLAKAGEERNLPAKRLMTFDPDLGETEEDAGPAILTRWRPDEGERRALANGALVELIVSGSGHPPVSMSVGQPPDSARPLLNAEHVDRAVGFWLTLIASHLLEHDGAFPNAEAALELWQHALRATREGTPEELAELQAAVEGRATAEINDAVKALREAKKYAIERGACTCQPKPSGEAPNEPDVNCPIHGAATAT